MSLSVARICDPRYQSLEDAVREARLGAQTSPRFELTLVRFLQIQCMASNCNLPAIFQGLEVLGRVADEKRLIALLRPFLRSGIPRIASKAALVAGRHCSDLKSLIKAVDETESRTRANLIESLWGRHGPGVQELLENALSDPHHRVAANAVYGLYLRRSHLYPEGLNRLHRSQDPWFRRSAIWVLRSVEGSDVAGSLKPFIVDPDPSVRHAAFSALICLRDGLSKKDEEAKKPVVAELPDPVINLQAGVL